MREFFYFNPMANGEKLIIPYRFSIPKPKIINSCNSLMLLQSDPPSHGPEECCVYVYNPTTRQSRKISLSGSHSSKYPYVADLVLAFDPSKSPHYKIVCVRSTDDYRNYHPGRPMIYIYQIEVYDSQSHTWKQGMEPMSCTFKIRKSGGVYFNGLIYWDSAPDTRYLDIATNEMKTAYQPDWYPIHPTTTDQCVIIPCSPLLQVSNGHLYHCKLMSGRCESIMVWELQGEDPSKWLLKYHDIVSQRPYNGLTSPFLLRFIEGSHGSEMRGFVSVFSGKLRVYNFLDKSHKEILDLRGPPFKYKEQYLNCYEFGESLAVV